MASSPAHRPAVEGTPMHSPRLLDFDPARHVVGQRDRALVLDYLAQPDPGMDHPAVALSFDDFDVAQQALIDTSHAVRYWPNYQARLTSIGLAAHAAARRALDDIAAAIPA